MVSCVFLINTIGLSLSSPLNLIISSLVILVEIAHELILQKNALSEFLLLSKEDHLLGLRWEPPAQMFTSRGASLVGETMLRKLGRCCPNSLLQTLIRWLCLNLGFTDKKSVVLRLIYASLKRKERSLDGLRRWAHPELAGAMPFMTMIRAPTLRWVLSMKWRTPK